MHYKESNKHLAKTIEVKNPSQQQEVQKTQSVGGSDSEKQLKYRIQKLEGELEDKDKDFERRIRALR